MIQFILNFLFTFNSIIKFNHLNSQSFLHIGLFVVCIHPIHFIMILFMIRLEKVMYLNLQLIAIFDSFLIDVWEVHLAFLQSDLKFLKYFTMSWLEVTTRDPNSLILFSILPIINFEWFLFTGPIILKDHLFFSQHPQFLYWVIFVLRTSLHGMFQNYFSIHEYELTMHRLHSINLKIPPLIFEFEHLTHLFIHP